MKVCSSTPAARAHEDFADIVVDALYHAEVAGHSGTSKASGTTEALAGSSLPGDRAERGCWNAGRRTSCHRARGRCWARAGRES